MFLFTCLYLVYILLLSPLKRCLSSSPDSFLTLHCHYFPVVPSLYRCELCCHPLVLNSIYLHLSRPYKIITNFYVHYSLLSYNCSGDIASKMGKDSQNYTVSGGFQQLDDQTILINELPVGKWTTDYKQVKKIRILKCSINTNCAHFWNFYHFFCLIFVV